MILLPPLVADGEPLTLQTLTKSQLVQCTREAIRVSLQYRPVRLEHAEIVHELEKWWPIDLPIDKNWVNLPTKDIVRLLRNLYSYYAQSDTLNIFEAEVGEQPRFDIREPRSVVSDETASEESQSWAIVCRHSQLEVLRLSSRYRMLPFLSLWTKIREQSGVKIGRTCIGPRVLTRVDQSPYNRRPEALSSEKLSLHSPTRQYSTEEYEIGTTYYCRIQSSAKHLCRLCGTQFDARRDLLRHTVLGIDCALRSTRARDDKLRQHETLFKLGLISKKLTTSSRVKCADEGEQRWVDAKVEHNLSLRSVYSIEATSQLGRLLQKGIGVRTLDEDEQTESMKRLTQHALNQYSRHRLLSSEPFDTSTEEKMTSKQKNVTRAIHDCQVQSRPTPYEYSCAAGQQLQSIERMQTLLAQCRPLSVNLRPGAPVNELSKAKSETREGCVNKFNVYVRVEPIDNLPQLPEKMQVHNSRIVIDKRRCTSANGMNVDNNQSANENVRSQANSSSDTSSTRDDDCSQRSDDEKSKLKESNNKRRQTKSTKRQRSISQTSTPPKKITPHEPRRASRHSRLRQL